MNNDLEQFAAALEASRNEYLKEIAPSPEHNKNAAQGLRNLPRKHHSHGSIQREASKVNSRSTLPKKAKAKEVWKPKGKVVHRITLRVQKKHIAAYEFYTHDSYKLSKLDSEKDAKDAANNAGYPIIVFVEKWESF